jgi:hypothetical protein
MIFHIEHRAADGAAKPAKAGPLARWLGWTALGVSAFLIVTALAVAATAAALVGLIAAAALAASRLGARRPKGAPSADVLEARRTAEGWIVEAAPRPR